ncbi:MAG: hypothetical protein VZQ62_00405 [Methanosphaera sp.]|nr:hypothetical protein [Methanosphaera sp.]
MVKIKVKDKSDYIESIVKYKDTTILELITLIDRSIDILRKEHEMTEVNVWETLENYRMNLKEVE